MTASDAALIVIDMQNDFCQPTSRLYVKGAPAILPTLSQAVKAFRAAGAPVIFVVRQHRGAGLDVDFTREDLFHQQPFLVSSPGTDIVDALRIEPGDVVVVKRRWSAFFATDLDLLLRRLGVRAVVLAGVQTPTCIRATANDASSLDYHCAVLSDSTASTHQAIQEANLYDMAQMGIEILTTQQAIGQFAPLEPQALAV
jgi:nicotinamidase-related amidase